MQTVFDPGVLQVLVVVLLVAVLALLFALLRHPRTAPNPEPPPPPDRDPPVVHNFLAPHQLGLLVEHSPELGPAALAERLSQNGLLAGNDDVGEFFIAPERIATFRNGAETFSLAQIEAPRLDNAEQVIGLVKRLNEQIDSSQAPPSVDRTKQLRQPDASAGDAPSGPVRANNGQSVDEPAVRQAVANWLSNAAANNGPGSPGARPVAVRPGTIDFSQASMLELLRPSIPGDLLEEVMSIEPVADVQVFVLDTLPDELDLAQGFDRWTKGFGDPAWAYPPNRIIGDLLAPGGPLGNRHYLGAAHVLQLANFIIPSHDYVMTDHGLFVAAIINALAPRARLQMVEVLNPFGVGSLESIARGFALAAQAVAPEARVVVNASLALDLPTANEAWWIEYVKQEYPLWQQFSREQIAAGADPLARICALFRTGGRAPAYPYTGIVAAAGNDNLPEMTKRPPARLPAAFDGVLGVGALNHDGLTAAPYTNQADTIPTEALSAYGGDAGARASSQAAPYADPNHGIVGPYLGALPDGTPNITGGARWAGTSFAAPIVSGLIAALMGQPGTTFADAEQRVRLAFAQARANQPDPTLV